MLQETKQKNTKQNRKYLKKKFLLENLAYIYIILYYIIFFILRLFDCKGGPIHHRGLTVYFTSYIAHRHSSISTLLSF